MADTEKLEAILELKDNFSNSLQKMAKKAKEFKEQADKIEPIIKAKDQVTSRLNKIKKGLFLITKGKKFISLNAKDKATPTLKKIRKQLLMLKAKRIALMVKDKATSAIRKVGNFLSQVVKKRWKAKIGVKDGATSILNKIKGLLTVLAAGVVIKATLQSGAKLEQQRVSMEHFMGVGNPGKSRAETQKMTQQYMKALQKNANATPYSTSEVLTAGTRALTIAQGDTKQAMRLIQLSEDMAAADSNKTLGDAIEAIADAQMGEFERMKEFGFKGSKEAFDKAGGDFFKMKSAEKNPKTLNEIFGGLAAKQSNTPEGKWSTIVGNLGTIQQNLGKGFLKGIDSTLTKIRDKIKELFGSDDSQSKFIEFGSKVGKVFNDIFDFTVKLADNIMTISKIFIEGLHVEEIKQAFQPAIDGMKMLFDSVSTHGPGTTLIFQALGMVVSVVLQTLGHLVSIFVDMFVTGSLLIKAASDGIKSAWQSLSKKFSAIKQAIVSAVDSIKQRATGAMNAIKGAVDGVKQRLQTFADKWIEIKNRIESNPIVQTISRVISGDSGEDPDPRGRGRGSKPKAMGQRRIPYNGFLARLHEGERVLTKNEANKLDNEKPNTNINITINADVRGDSDIKKIVNLLVKEIKLQGV